MLGVIIESPHWSSLVINFVVNRTGISSYIYKTHSRIHHGSQSKPVVSAVVVSEEYSSSEIERPHFTKSERDLHEFTIGLSMIDSSHKSSTWSHFLSISRLSAIFLGSFRRQSHKNFRRPPSPISTP